MVEGFPEALGLGLFDRLRTLPAAIPQPAVRRPNIRYFIDHHVTGIFEEDTPDTPHSELAELGDYLMAKFLWNPDYDPDVAMNEFLDGFYGKAARPIRQYINSCTIAWSGRTSMSTSTIRRRSHISITSSSAGRTNSGRKPKSSRRTAQKFLSGSRFRG